MIRIVIAEDQRMLRGALGALLDFEEDLEVVGQAENGNEALKLIMGLNPDICLMDIEMPLKSGLEVATELKQLGSSSKIIILTTFARPGYFEKAMKAGVHGYLLKDGSIDELASSIRNVMDGKREYSPELIMNSYNEDNPLTEREQEILKLAAEGKTGKEISTILFLSQGTVRNYMSEILQKLDSKNKIEAITVAQEKGWI
ncbi:response regulator transcription factor [Lederbergia wuyishanensis]|uniref:Two-component system response regulator DesR n=1 Tax=Lederbergia wuyishanensis TaxID=1347903 RepID=A0ABU0D602_9BACI|nr:response regulator transcription factor [Lederbergia wuyishanensis]MCJ8008414.1 response regulator transcription factor [Lederbergia wuyishanensis]MDQ0343831.1 two-component system response regulator DesR [Lederbergia wuyishanensis]